MVDANGSVGVMAPDDSEQQPVSLLAQLLAGNRLPSAPPTPMAPPTAAGVAPAPGTVGNPAPPVQPTGQPAPTPYQTSPPNRVAPMGVVPPQTPMAPAPPTLDLSGRDALASKVAALQKPTDPNDPSVKAHWYDRLLGGAVGFGQGWQHNPNAAEVGGEVTNRKYNTAESLRKGSEQGAETELSNFDRDTQDKQRDYENKSQQFEHEMQGVNQYRENQLTQSQMDKNEAYATKVEQMSPEERAQEIPRIEGVLGHPLTKDQKDEFTLNGKVPAEKTPGAHPKTIAEGLFSDDPRDQKIAQGAFAEEHNSAERAAASAARANQPKPATKGEFSGVQRDRNKGWAKADEDYQKEHDEKVQPLYDAAKNAKPENGMSADQVRAKKLEVAQAADKAATDRLNKTRQTVQDEYESGIETLGGSSKHVDVNAGNQKPAAGGGGKPTPAAGGKTAPRGDKSLIGKPAMVGNKQVTITGINPETGKYTY